MYFSTGIDVDIDVEHEGKKAKVTPTPPASSGPPSAPSDCSSEGLFKRVVNGSTTNGEKVTK